MKKIIIFIIATLILSIWTEGLICLLEKKQVSFSLEGLSGLEKVYLSPEAKSLLKQNGFVVTPGFEKEIYDIYANCKKKNQPIFVTTDAVLHTSHIFFDYLLRILEMEKLYDLANELTDRMLDFSENQYKKAKDKAVKQAARLNLGFFSVSKKIFSPEYQAGYELEDLISKEINNMNAHEEMKFRELLTYVENPSLFETPYAYEDYSQYIPRGHYTRNEKFKKYFKVMMWYGRIDFKLKPKKTENAIIHGRKMTLQALLMTDALMRDERAFQLWKMIYGPTVYFVGKTDDLYAGDYMNLIREVFSLEM